MQKHSMLIWEHISLLSAGFSASCDPNSQNACFDSKAHFPLKGTFEYIRWNPAFSSYGSRRFLNTFADMPLFIQTPFLPAAACLNLFSDFPVLIQMRFGLMWSYSSKSRFLFKSRFFDLTPFWIKTGKRLFFMNSPVRSRECLESLWNESHCWTPETGEKSKNATCLLLRSKSFSAVGQKPGIPGFWLTEKSVFKQANGPFAAYLTFGYRSVRRV